LEPGLWLGADLPEVVYLALLRIAVVGGNEEAPIEGSSSRS